MKNNFRVFIVSLLLTFLTVSFLSNLDGEVATLGLFPGFIFNWFIEQLLIEIRDESYFELGNYSVIFNFGFYFIASFIGLKLLLLTLNFRKKKDYR